MTPHSFVPLSVPGNRPNERDIIRTMVCKRCTLRHVVNVGTGESLSGDLLKMFSDCDEFLVMTVMNT